MSVEWEDGEVTVWNKVTHENGLTIPLDQLESIIRKAMPDAFRSQSIDTHQMLLPIWLRVSRVKG